jgi:hypothetical protein
MVESVSSALKAEGEPVMSRHVFELPPRESLRRYVSLESR